MHVHAPQIDVARRTAYRRLASFANKGQLPPPLPLPPPKVALMFITRGDLPYEPLWRAFLDSTPLALQQLGAQGANSSSLNSSSNGSSAHRPAPPWQQLFTIYTHPPPNHTHPPNNMFAGHEVPDRLPVQWGNHSMVGCWWVPATAAGNCSECMLAAHLHARIQPVPVRNNSVAALIDSALLAHPSTLLPICRWTRSGRCFERRWLTPPTSVLCYSATAASRSTRRR